MPLDPCSKIAFKSVTLWPRSLPLPSNSWFKDFLFFFFFFNFYFPVLDLWVGRRRHTKIKTKQNKNNFWPTFKKIVLSHKDIATHIFLKRIHVIQSGPCKISAPIPESLFHSKKIELEPAKSHTITSFLFLALSSKQT